MHVSYDENNERDEEINPIRICAQEFRLMVKTMMNLSADISSNHVEVIAYIVHILVQILIVLQVIGRECLNNFKEVKTS